jgi:PST family polysaccharide transporter
MKAKILRFLKTDLFKTSFLNGIANIIKMLTGLVTNKIVAVYLGPSGVALLGQFHNFTTIVMSVAGLGLEQGITKYTSEYQNDEKNKKAILSTGFIVALVCSIIISFIVLINKNYLSRLILKTNEYSIVFVILGLTLIFFVFNSFFTAVLNGHKEYKKIIATKIISAILGLIIVVIFIVKYNILGAFLGFILSQTLVFFVTLNWVYRSKWFSFESFFKFFDKQKILKLGGFTLMAFTTLFASSFIQLQIRTYIINHISDVEAGYWQGVIRICDLYIMFVTTTLAIYYLPRLSELKTNKELNKEIFKGYKFILPLVVLSSALIFLFKGFIIDVLFSSSFAPMRNLFLFQLSGNILKIASWLLSYLMLAKAMTKVFIITEIAFGLLYYLLTILFINEFGIIGATYAYFTCYVLYLLTMIFIFKDLVFLKKKELSGFEN